MTSTLFILLMIRFTFLSAELRQVHSADKFYHKTITREYCLCCANAANSALL